MVFNAIFEHLNRPETEQQTAVESILPTISIQAANLVIDEGEIAVFRVNSLSSVSGTSIIVVLHITSVGAFFEFDQLHTRTVSLQGQESVDLFFPTIDDTLAEDDGAIKVAIVEQPYFYVAENQSSASIIVSDAIDRNEREEFVIARAQAFLPDAIGNMAARTSDSIEFRFQQAFSGTDNVTLNLSGQETIRGMIKESGEILNDSDSLTSLRSFVSQSSFSLPLFSAEQFNTSTSIWGIGDYRDLLPNSSSGSDIWKANSFTGHIGLDTKMGQEILTGISATFNENIVDFYNQEDTEYSLEYTQETISINPFVGWKSPRIDAEIRTIAGFGGGEFAVDQAFYDVETFSSRSYSFAIAGNKVLHSSNSILNGTSKLSIIGESWWARQYIDGREGVLADLQANAQYYQIRTERINKYTFDYGSSFTTLISVGIRGDEKAKQSTSGMEFIGSFDFDNPLGLTWTGKGSILLANEDSIQIISTSSSFEFDHDNDELGMLLELTPSWGQANTKNRMIYGVVT